MEQEIRKVLESYKWEKIDSTTIHNIKTTLTSILLKYLPTNHTKEFSIDDWLIVCTNKDTINIIPTADCINFMDSLERSLTNGI